MDKWEYYRIFIGKNADYYIEKFKKFEETGGALSWNWAAFFLGVLWVFYRKMYLYGSVIFLLIILIGAFLSVAGKNNQLLAIGVQIWIWIGFGAFGNYLYYIHVKNKVSQIQERYPSEELKLQLAKEGGTSILAPLIFIMIIFIIQLIVAVR